MDLTQWYELRVAGSAGTRAGTAQGANEGVAISEIGRLCPIGSGRAKRFQTEREAIEYLENTTIPKMYDFEAVRCEGDAEHRQP